jgi:hypothetical protein
MTTFTTPSVCHQDIVDIVLLNTIRTFFSVTSLSHEDILRILTLEILIVFAILDIIIYVDGFWQSQRNTAEGHRTNVS